LPDYARQRPEAIRDALTEKHIAADSKLARFVGLAAYEAAGGAVLRDLFDADNAGWLTDRELVEKLAAEKLEAAAATVRGEGWKWVEIIPGLDWEILHHFGHAVSEQLPPTEAQQREIEALTAEGNAIIDEHGEEPEDEAALDRLYEIQERVAELSEGEESWPDTAKAEAGAVIGIGHNGDLDIRCGLIRPEERAAAKKAAKATALDGAKPASATAGLSAALTEQLTAHRTAALQARLAGNPKVAFAAVVYALALDCLYDPFPGSCVRIDAKMTYLGGSAEGIDDSVAYKQFAASTKAATKGMPKQPEKLWAWLIEQDQKALLAILAICAAMTVDAVEKKRGAAERAPGSAHAAQLGQALKLDMAEYWQSTAEGYFGNVPKTLIIEAVREAIGPGAADKIAALKKDAMAKRAAALIKDKGWLPAILR
jgi:ParB family chromosome partitioning protein